MRQHSSVIAIFSIGCGLLANTSTAQAGNESWVSRTGADTGSCPITAPCRTFAYAHNQTSNNGSINVLTSGNFGPVTISKPISIVAEGVEALINAADGGGAIVVQAGGGAVVSLRGLTIDVPGTNSGIVLMSGGALHIRDCTIRRGANGIRFEASGTSELYVGDSTVAFNDIGILTIPTGSGSASVTLDRVRAENASGEGIRFNGVNTTGTIVGTVRDSVSSGATRGIQVDDSGGGSTKIMVERTTLVNNNNFGIQASGSNTTVWLGDSTIIGNATALSIIDADVFSYLTNRIDGNGALGDLPTPTDLR